MDILFVAGKGGGVVGRCRIASFISVLPGTHLRHRLELQGRVALLCLLGRSDEMTDDVVAGCMK